MNFHHLHTWVGGGIEHENCVETQWMFLGLVLSFMLKIKESVRLIEPTSSHFSVESFFEIDRETLREKKKNHYFTLTFSRTFV